MLREQIALMPVLKIGDRYATDATKILSLIEQEIKRVENPKYYWTDKGKSQHNIPDEAFETIIKAILKHVKGEGK
jgi:CTP:phosphocholine cytidylyltransferase-like protein